jgi:uncharacterized membrane protein YedE/YeeE
MLPEQLSHGKVCLLKAFMMVVGGFFGFGSRYAGGCTSGHYFWFV